MKRAFLRLFLILFPLILFGIALFLTNKNKPLSHTNTPLSHTNTPLSQKKESFLKGHPECPFYYGFSFFPLKEKKQNLFTNQRGSAPFISYLLSKQSFLKKVQDVKTELKKHNLSLKKILWELPLVLTKDKKWLISKKSFFILPTGERKEFSHLPAFEVEALHKNFMQNKFYTILKLSEMLPILPDSHFLFLIGGSHKKNLMEKLKTLPLKKTTGDIFFSSSNEKLLRDMALKTDWKILHSFKSLARWQIMKIFQAHSWKEFLGAGFLLPPMFSLPLKDLETLKKQKKLLFLKKDPPYTPFHQSLIQKSNALISSKPPQAFSIIKQKKPCFMEK